MNTDKKYHVLGLTPREQLILRSLLFNAYAAWVDKVIKESHSSNEEQLDQKASYTYKLFCKYNDIIDLLANEENIGKSKPTCLVLNEEAIKLIGIAVRGFDEKNNYLGDKANYVMDYYPNLKEKVLQSIEHKYSKKEIEEAKKD